MNMTIKPLKYEDVIKKLDFQEIKRAHDNLNHYSSIKLLEWSGFNMQKILNQTYKVKSDE